MWAGSDTCEDACNALPPNSFSVDAGMRHSALSHRRTHLAHHFADPDQRCCCALLVSYEAAAVAQGACEAGQRTTLSLLQHNTGTSSTQHCQHSNHHTHCSLRLTSLSGSLSSTAGLYIHHHPPPSPQTWPP